MTGTFVIDALGTKSEFMFMQEVLTESNKLSDYDSFVSSFKWESERKNLTGLPEQKGINIAYEAIDRHAEMGGKDHVALRWIGKDNSSWDFTYGDLKVRTSKFANVLTMLGVSKGESVFSLLGRTPELYIVALGTLKKLAVFCPLYSVFGPEPIAQRMKIGRAKILVTTLVHYEKKIQPILPQLNELKHVLLIDVGRPLNDVILSLPFLMEKASRHFNIPPTSENDEALLHFTSGTTGMPKGALHVHRAVLMHYVTGKYVLDLKKDDVFWCTADPGWVTGTSYGIIAPLVNGVTTIVDEDEFDARRWFSILEHQKVTVWYTAPTAIRRLMRLDYNPKSVHQLDRLRLVASVGEPLHAEAVVWGSENLGRPIFDNWWQTETGGIMIANYPFMKVKPGSMGKPLPGIEVAIAHVSDKEITLVEKPGEPGNLVIKKGWPSMFIGYLNETDRYKKCFRGDWYITGDLARRDEDGYYWFVGRDDDIIKTSGHMVGPYEVETVLMDHLAVAEAAVIGKPDPMIGELVKAYVVLKDKYTETTELRLDILGHARRRLGPAVAPKEITFVSSLPKTKSGKILRRLLKARELGLPEGDLSTLENN